MNPQLHVVLAMPRAILRLALAQALAGERMIVTDTGDVGSTPFLAGREHADVAVVALDEGTGPAGFDLRWCPQIIEASPATRVLLLGEAATTNLVRGALEVGARGVFETRQGLDLLVRAIRAVADGELWISRSVMESLIGPVPTEPVPADPTPLTARERQVLRLLGEGKDHHVIAAALVVSPHTARTHIRNVIRKLGAHSRLEAVAIAHEQGLLVATSRATALGTVP